MSQNRQEKEIFPTFSLSSLFRNKNQKKCESEDEKFWQFSGNEHEAAVIFARQEKKSKMSVNGHIEELNVMFTSTSDVYSGIAWALFGLLQLKRRGELNETAEKAKRATADRPENKSHQAGIKLHNKREALWATYRQLFKAIQGGLLRKY